MHGVFVSMHRPSSKAAVKRAVAAGASVRLEATSLFGDEYEGDVFSAPDGCYTFVGPDPYNSRKFYGTFIVRNGTVKVI